MIQEHLNIMDGHIYAYLLIDPKTTEILDGNKLAASFYRNAGRFLPLEEIFSPLVEDAVLADLIQTLHQEGSTSINNITSHKSSGESFPCHIELCRVDEDLLFLVVKELCKVRDSQIQDIVELIDNPIYCLHHDEPLTIDYGNTRCHQCLPSKGREETSLFLDQMEQDKRLRFSQMINHQFECFGECDVDIELNFGTELSQLYRFNAYKSTYDSRIYGVLISAKKQSELIKKIEYDQQYFDIMQKYSKDLLFRIDVAKQTLVHRGDISKLVGLEPEITSFPESMRNNRLVHPDDLEGYIAFVYLLMAGTETSFETRFQFNDGTYEKYRLQGTPMFDEGGQTVQVVGKCENIQKFADIEAKAHYDSLTTTLNKQSFRELVENYLHRAVDQDRFALLFLDLDDFKGVNDNLGHVFGDFLLEAMAKRILNCIRKQDRVGRVGGDEFVIFFQYAPNNQAVQERAEAILHSLRRDFTFGEQRCKIRASIGISMYPAHGETYETLYHHADKALYKSKALGKDVATIYNDSLK